MITESTAVIECSICKRDSWILDNLMVFTAYWGVSHLNGMVFRGVGVLPMPIWPAAAVALVAAIMMGYRVAPGIVLAAIATNRFSLGSSLVFACCISIMNTVGPVLGAGIIRKKVLCKPLSTWKGHDVTMLLLAGVVLVPALTALGGIVSKWMLGFVPGSDVVPSLLRWFLAHALGTLLFAPPLLILFAKGGGHECGS